MSISSYFLKKTSHINLSHAPRISRIRLLHKISPIHQLPLLFDQYPLLSLRNRIEVFGSQFNDSINSTIKQILNRYVRICSFRLLGLSRIKKIPKYPHQLVYLDTVLLIINGCLQQVGFLVVLIMLVEVIQIMDKRLIYTKK